LLPDRTGRAGVADLAIFVGRLAAFAGSRRVAGARRFDARVGPVFVGFAVSGGAVGVVCSG